MFLSSSSFLYLKIDRAKSDILIGAAINFLNENSIWVENHGQKCKFKMVEFWLGVVILVKLKRCHNSRKVTNKTFKVSCFNISATYTTGINLKKI